MNAFVIDMGETSGGSMGPWLSWSSDGSMKKGIQAASWVLRDKDEHGNKTEANVPAFTVGCVLDLDSLKLGWEEDGAPGMAPKRVWNPSVSQRTPAPDNRMKVNQKGKQVSVWSQALSIRCAIGGGRAATWEQAAFGAYRGFAMLAEKIMAQHPGDNTLPLVKQAGVTTIPGVNTAIPVLEIVKWVPRPDCLKVDAPVIAMESTPAPQPGRAVVSPVAQPQPTPAMADIDAEIPF